MLQWVHHYYLSIQIVLYLLHHPLPTVKVTENTTDTNLKPAMEADATSGKKNFIYNECTFKYASWYIEKKKWTDVSQISQTCTYVSKYSSHMLKYINIYSYI